MDKKSIERIKLRTQMSEMKHVIETSRYAFMKENAEKGLSVLQESYKNIFGEYSKDHIIEDVNESRGGMLDGAFDNMHDLVQSLKEGSNKITDNEIKDLTVAVDELRGKFKKVLHGKGIIGW